VGARHESRERTEFRMEENKRPHQKTRQGKLIITGEVATGKKITGRASNWKSNYTRGEDGSFATATGPQKNDPALSRKSGNVDEGSEDA